MTTTAIAPDLAQGVPLSSVPDGGMLLGEANGEAVLLALAVALVRRDLDGLRAEVEFERIMRGEYA